MADLTLTTPEEYISYYFTALQNELNIYDLQANKYGFLGAFLNILGHTNYDTKQYYDSLFKEAFVATSQEDKNLFVHASTYGYIPGFCQASNAVGNFVFDFADLPKKADQYARRDVYFGTDDSLVQFEIDGYTFTSTSKYKFVEEDDQYYCVIFTQDGKILQIPSASSKITVPMYDVYQYSVEEFTIDELETYTYGTFASTTFEISQPEIYELEVYVQKTSDTTETKYDIKRVKYFEEPFSQVVFFSKISDTKFQIEYGSGIRGEWIPGAKIRVVVKVTYGSSGNLNKSTITITRDANQSSYQTTSTSHITLNNLIADSNNILTVDSSSSLNPSYVTANFEYSENGTAQTEGETLRKEIVSYIQTRNNMVNQNDFYNITSKYLSDFKFLFKKSHVMDNTFYLCRTFRDKYQVVIPTINKSIMTLNQDLNVRAPQYIERKTTDGSLTFGTYYYRIVAGNRFSLSSKSEILTANITSTNNTLYLHWPKHPGAEYYRVYCRTQTATNYFEVYDNCFLDTGSDTNLIIDTDIESNVINTEIWYPKYQVNTDNIYSINTDSCLWKKSSIGTNVYYFSNPTYIEKPSVIYENIMSWIQNCKQTKITTTSLANTITIQWPSVPGAKSYRVYGRFENAQDRYWETTSTSFTDSGNNDICLFEQLPYPTDILNSTTNLTITSSNTTTGTLTTNSYGYVVYAGDVNVLSENDDPSTMSSAHWYYGDLDNVGFSTIYVRLSDDTSPSEHSEQYLVANKINTENFISPFLYKYNDLMTWYDAYLIYRFLVVNFNSFTLQDLTVNPPTIYLNLDYQFYNKKTIIYLKSYQDLSDFTFKMTIEDLSIYDVDLTKIDDNNFKYEYISDTGRLEDPVQIKIYAYQNGTSVFETITNKFSQVINISDQLRLLTFIHGSDRHILTIPCMKTSVFEDSEQEFLQKLYDFLVGFSFTENRMQTDNVQFRFMNTHYFEHDYLKLITLQNYEFDLVYPLKLRVDVKIQKAYVAKNNIILSDVRTLMLDSIANFLQTMATGFQLKYYNSQIEDLIHNFGVYVLYVKATVTDSSDNPNVIESGFELNEETDLMENLRPYKLKLVKYTPHFTYWDVDNIDLRLTY